MNSFFNQDFTPRSARDFVSSLPKPQKMDNFEDLAIGAIGQELYDAFIKGYTEKQWQTKPNLLPPETFSRLPVRFNFNSGYFNDTWEGLPTKGYFGLFQEMISNPLISINLGLDFFSLRAEIDPSAVLIYTGAIDQYFEFEFGPLTWRTLDFDFEILNVDDFQGTSVMNYADLDDAFTRIHEFKHLHPERVHVENKTIIAREYSRFAAHGDEPYYPVNTAQDRMKLLKYRQLAKGSPNVLFGGRLGSYKYLDMHMAVASALQLFNNRIYNQL
jgi:UDP-galactopyranose mutase